MEDPLATPAPDYAHRVAMYDMDRTITRSGTYSGFLMHVAQRRQQWRLLLLPLVVLAGAAYSLRLIDRSRLKAINLRLLVGKRFSRTEIVPLAESYADKVVARGLHPAALDQIAADREAGYRLLLATASFHLYVDAIARRLGIDDVIATDLHVSRGMVQARIAGHNCYGPHKAEMIADWMAEHHLDRATCHIRCYSDHVSDVPMLELADEAFVTNAHMPMRLVARAQGWPELDWPAGIAPPDGLAPPRLSR